MDQQLSINVSSGALELSGELDGEGAPRLTEALADAGGAPVTVDLAGVTFMDSGGLRAILKAREDHEGIRFMNPTHAVVRLLDITGTLDTVLGHAGPGARTTAAHAEQEREVRSDPSGSVP